MLLRRQPYCSDISNTSYCYRGSDYMPIKELQVAKLFFLTGVCPSPPLTGNVIMIMSGKK